MAENMSEDTVEDTMDPSGFDEALLPNFLPNPLINPPLERRADGRVMPWGDAIGSSEDGTLPPFPTNSGSFPSPNTANEFNAVPTSIENPPSFPNSTTTDKSEVDLRRSGQLHQSLSQNHEESENSASHDIEDYSVHTDVSACPAPAPCRKLRRKVTKCCGGD